MEKLTLKNINLNENELLKKDQLKTVFGGNSPADCADLNACFTWADWTLANDPGLEHYNYASTSGEDRAEMFGNLFDWCAAGNVGVAIHAGCVS